MAFPRREAAAWDIATRVRAKTRLVAPQNRPVVATISLAGDPPNARVLLDGVDISAAVRGLALRTESSMVILSLDLVVDAEIVADCVGLDIVSQPVAGRRG